MTFLIILGVTEILYSFRLALEGKTGKKILELSRFKVSLSRKEVIIKCF